MNFIPLTDPDQITAQLRLLKIYQHQRREAGPGNTDLGDLLQEAQIAARLLEAQNRLLRNLLGETIRRSIEGE